MLVEKKNKYLINIVKKTNNLKQKNSKNNTYEEVFVFIHFVKKKIIFIMSVEDKILI